MRSRRRLPYFDMLKGIAIFLVVMGHVLTMCIRDIDRALLFKIIGQVHMPLFFFISGYFTYKVSADGTPYRRPDLIARFKQLVVPGVVTGVLWMFYFPHSGLQSPFDMTFRGMWLTEFKNGYWFTITLFLIIVVYRVWSNVLRKISSTGRAIAASIGLWGLMVAANMFAGGGDVWRLFSLELVIAFFPAFLAGVFAGKNPEGFRKLCARKGVYTTALLGSGFLLYLIVYPWDFPRLHTLVFTVASPLLHIGLAIVGITLVSEWSERAEGSSSRLNRGTVAVFSYLGTQSLAIYLLHYFFLFPMPFLQEPLRAMGLDLVPTFVVAAIAAAFVVGLTLLVNIIIGRSGLTGWLLTGKLPK